MTQAPYLHGYADPEQQRLLEQADYWRSKIILPGTIYRPGAEVLDIGCGVGAVLGVLGRAFPGVAWHGLDREPRQLARARRHLAGLGLKARLGRGDALALPYRDARFDAVWTMWVLEHVGDPVALLAEARRVLKPGGGFSGIEIDYRRILADPCPPAWRALLECFCRGMDRHGRADAGSCLPGWLADAGFRDIRPRPRTFVYVGAAAAPHVEYLLGFIESAIPDLAGLPLAPSEARLRQGARQLRALARTRTGRLQFTVMKAQARA